MMPDDHADRTNRQRTWRAVFGLIVLAMVAAVAFQLVSQSSSEKHRGLALQELPKMIPAQSKDLGGLVLANYREYRANAVRWSFAYFGCLFGSALASASAGVVLKLDLLKERATLKNDLAASLAALAALLVTLSTSGDFQRKWQSNRIAADAMENLSYDLLRGGEALSHDTVLDRIKAINDARSEGVVGKGDSEVGQEDGRPEEPAETPEEEQPADTSRNGAT